MAVVVAEWESSEHGKSYDDGVGANTYCSSCKAPPVADPLATSSDNEPVPVEDWTDVTCMSCHPSHDDRVAWGTPIGNYDVEAGAHFPVYDANELCVYCHSGDRHAKDFQGYGKSMFEKKLVSCADCHMADSPVVHPDSSVHMAESHTFEVASNLPYSCGIGEVGCHANKTVDWAVKQIEKMKIHSKKS